MEEIKIEKFESLKVFLKHYRGLVSLLLSLMVLFLGYALILSQPLKTYRDSLDLLNKLDTDLVTAQTQLTQAQTYSAKLYQVSAEDRRVLDMALPTKPDFSALIENVTSMAERSGFAVNNIDMEESNGRAGIVNNQNGSIGKVSLRLKLSGGGYEELKRFINLTENSIMMMDVSSINFNSQNPIYDISLLVYYYLTD